MKAKQIQKVLAMIEAGCRTSREIADATNIPRKHVSAYLSQLEDLRCIRRVGSVKFNRKGKRFTEWAQVA